MKKALIFIMITVMLALQTVSSPAAAVESGTNRRTCKSHPGPLLTLTDIAGSASRRNRKMGRAPSESEGTSDLPLVIIVIGFNDISYRNDFDWADTIFRKKNSVKAFYEDMSFGKFTFTPGHESSAYGGDNTNTVDTENDGIIHVTLNMPHDDWRLEFSFGSAKDIKTTGTLSDAVIAAIGEADESLDFSAYDVDGNGEITTDELAIGFVFAGYEASVSYSYSHGKEKYLWAHAWSLEEIRDSYDFDLDFPRPDGVTVNSYVAMSEQHDNGTQGTIGTLSHELGHYLGLPDLYDVDDIFGSEWWYYDMESLSLMSFDEWENPMTGEKEITPLDAWSRTVLGWTEPTIADSSGVYTVTAQDYEKNSGYEIIRIQTQNPGEYYLVENRHAAGRDLPIKNEYNTDNGGVVLWHIDDNVYEEYNSDNRVNSASHRPAVMPLFPEKNKSGDYTFIGTNKTPVTDSPFFDKAVWNKSFAHLGSTLDLPVYGTGSNADKRSARTYSGIRLEFLSNAEMTMEIRVELAEHVHEPALIYVTEPTCTEPGTAFYECVECSRRFSDEGCTIDTDEPFEVPALGHTKPNADGKCDRCGLQIKEGCPFCHRIHSSDLWGRLVSLLHRALYFFAHLFGKM